MINLDNVLTVLETMCREEWGQQPHLRIMVKNDTTAPGTMGALAGDLAHRLGNRKEYRRVHIRLMELRAEGKVVAWGPFFWPRGLYQALK